MTEAARSNAHADAPVYTIKTVVQETGIPSATLRAWERRYGVLSPGRSDGGYRLYSERDIATLRWLKAQVDAGVSISRAVALLQLRRRTGEEPERQPDRAGSDPPALPSAGARGAEAIGDELLGALLAYQEARVEAILTEAFALYPVETVAEDIIAPVLVRIGELWRRGEASIVQEHYATAILRRRLAGLFHAYVQPAAGPLAMTGAGPSEWHDVGILLVSLVLRRMGWQVIYLGQNVPADHLGQEILRLRPALVCLSASTRENAEVLADVYELVRDLPEPRPRLIFGGRAFNAHPELRSRFADSYIASSARELAQELGADGPR
ncbi:MAG: HTH-type transcriptional repressor YcgE [Chloroflexi bacterium ADurb.Bin325]|nr:MAG: HTH-type transcriptional repressor YcgE [Chloroflexi bacterium ADurb.Bin325]